LRSCIGSALLAVAIAAPAMAEDCLSHLDSGGQANAFASTRPLNLQLNLVRAIARQLRKKGYRVGEINGYYQPELRDSIAAFQRRSKLGATGDLDCETVHVILGIDLKERW